MPKQSNIGSLRNDKRIEALLKQEMNEHQHLISCHQKEMQSLRDELKFALEKCESLSERGDKALTGFMEFAVNHFSRIEEKMKTNEIIVSMQKETISDLHDKLLKFQDLYPMMSYVDKIKKDTQEQVKESTFGQLLSFQSFEKEIKILFRSLQNDLVKLREEIERRVDQISDKCDENFKLSRLDKEGVLKEVRIYERAVFVVEKKIENIYTLIERINKRSEQCPRQE